jgi:hypothetical protein
MRNKNLEMSKATRVSIAIALMGAAVSISGCGKVAYREPAANSTAPLSSSANNSTGSPSNSSSTLPDSNPNPTPAWTQNFVLKGNGLSISEKTFGPISTDNTLKVTVHAGQPMYAIIADVQSNTWVNYTCEQLTITVEGHSETVLVTNNPGAQQQGMPCYGAQESATVDFSDDLTPGQTEVHVKISDPLFDNCHNDPSYRAAYGAAATRYAGCQLDLPYTIQNTTQGVPNGKWTYYQLQGKIEVSGTNY